MDYPRGRPDIELSQLPTLPQRAVHPRDSSLARSEGSALFDSDDDEDAMLEKDDKLSELRVPDVEQRSVRTEFRRLSMSVPESGGDLAPVDKGVGAWSFVFFGWLLETFLWGFSYSFPSVLVFLEQNDPWKRSSLAALSAIGTVQISLQFITPVFVTLVLRRYPDWRTTMLVASTLINTGAMLASSWATKTIYLILLQGVLGGITGAILYTPVLLFLNDWFHEKRGLASGIIFSGTSFGGLALPFLINSLLEKHGFATMCRVWAGMTLFVYGGATFALRPRVPAAKPEGRRVPWSSLANVKVLADPVVIATLVTTFVASLPYFQVSFYLPTYTLSLASSTSSTTVVGVFNAAASVGSFVTGIASDWNLPWTLAIMGAASGLIALTAWGLATSLGVVFAFAVAYAFFSAIFSVWAVAAKDAAGANPHLSTFIVCAFGAARGVAAIIGPFIATTLHSSTSSVGSSSWGHYGFSRVIVFVGVLSFVSALGGPAVAYARRFKAQRKAAAQGQ
ncbi:hypothetical protein JCM10207_002605 [Rhodosporidiobolus poonsookiae]